MINVNQITSQLAKMPDNALQQYASMHKNDPYTVSLALAESNRRKEMRAGSMMGGQEQPKVVDQDIAGMAPPAPQQHMLPEEQGIGQLPAPNIQGMAGGGIVAFDEGGEVPRFDGVTNGSYVDPQMFNQLPAGSFGAPQAGAVENQSWAQRKMDELAAKVQAGTATPQEKAWVSMLGGDATARVNARQQQAIYQSAPDQLGGENARLAAQAQPITAKPPVVNPTAVTANPQTPPPPTGINTLGANPLGGGYEKRFADMLDKGAVSKEDRMKEFSDIDKPAIDKMQSMINEQKDKLSSDKEQDFYMSLIQGGLAAAGGNSPNALQNIAQGFEKGAGNYNAALKDLRKAAQENSKMEMELARYESSGKKDALKAYYDHADKVEGYKAQGIAQIMGHEISSAGSIAAAGAGANAQRGLMEALGSAPEGSALRKGFEMTKQEGRIPMMYDAYVKAASDPMKGEDFLRKYPTFEVYKAGMGGEGAGQFVNLPNNAAPSTAVLPRKN